MIKTLVILVILAWLVVFGIVLALISTLDDLCEYEKKIKALKEEMEKAKRINIDDYYQIIEHEKRINKILGEVGDDKE